MGKRLTCDLCPSDQKPLHTVYRYYPHNGKLACHTIRCCSSCFGDALRVKLKVTSAAA
jgi:hypothetical protein